MVKQNVIERKMLNNFHFWHLDCKKTKIYLPPPPPCLFLRVLDTVCATKRHGCEPEAMGLEGSNLPIELVRLP